MNHFQLNHWNTTQLVLNIMERVANQVGVDINDNSVADKLYDICCDLEDWPEDEGFGSSDSYSYTKAAEKEFGK